MMIYKYYVFDSELVMHPDGKGGSLGTVVVNDTVYHVTMERGCMQINGQVVTRYSADLGFEVTKYIATDQQMSAWYLAQHGKEFFGTVKDKSIRYCVGAITFYVYRSEDGTCWQYYTGKDVYECQHYSPWYPAVIPPSFAHFKQWVRESIHMESDVEKE